MASIKDLGVLWYLFFVITLLHGPTLLVIFALNNRTRHLYISMFEDFQPSNQTTERTKMGTDRQEKRNGSLGVVVTSMFQFCVNSAFLLAVVVYTG